MAALQLTEIWIYPIKSLGGIQVSTARVLPKGLEYDRRWMLTDEHGMFMTQRAHPKMALFKCALENNRITVTYQQDKIVIPFEQPAVVKEIQVKVWDDTVTAVEAGLEYSHWFTERLGLTCKLVHFPENNPRPVDPQYKVNDDHVSLADGYPFLIIGQSSLDDLNGRLDIPVLMDRFRPNFVFTGGEPYEEESWHNFAIGNNHFVGVKPCGRCVMTTVNQETGEGGAEPLKTLASYRRKGNKVLFGQNVIALESGSISVGDKLQITPVL